MGAGSGEPDQYRLETLYYYDFLGWGPESPTVDPLMKSKPVLRLPNYQLNINNRPSVQTDPSDLNNVNVWRT